MQACRNWAPAHVRLNSREKGSVNLMLLLWLSLFCLWKFCFEIKGQKYGMPGLLVWIDSLST